MSTNNTMNALGLFWGPGQAHEAGHGPATPAADEPDHDNVPILMVTPPDDESEQPGTMAGSAGSSGKDSEPERVIIAFQNLTPDQQDEVNKAITTLQNIWPERKAALKAGKEVRSHYQVSTVRDGGVNTGIVQVKIQGDAETFAGVGIEGMDTSKGPKELHYLRVPSEGFQGHVVGGDDIHGRAAQQALVSGSLPEAKSHAYINGSYYNMANRADEKKDEHIPIGETATSGGAPIPSLPVPAEYGDDYRTLSFDDGSKVTSGPVLSEKGEASFPQEKIEERRYQYRADAPARFQPGVLMHAQDRNARSGVSVPGDISSGDAYRLAVGLKNSEHGRGFTGPEWSNVMTRLDRLNQTPGGSLNLDGGGSSALGAVNSEGKELMDVRQNQQRGASTLIAFSGGPGIVSDQKPARLEKIKAESEQAEIAQPDENAVNPEEEKKRKLALENLTENINRAISRKKNE